MLVKIVYVHSAANAELNSKIKIGYDDSLALCSGQTEKNTTFGAHFSIATCVCVCVCVCVCMYTCQRHLNKPQMNKSYTHTHIHTYLLTYINTHIIRTVHTHHTHTHTHTHTLIHRPYRKNVLSYHWPRAINLFHDENIFILGLETLVSELWSLSSRLK